MKLRYSYFSCDMVKIPILSSVGCSSDIKETRFGPATRNEYLIHYVVSGKGYFNGCPVGEGQGFLISPQMFEHYYSDPKDPWTYLWIISTDPAMEYFFKMHQADPQTNVFHFRNKHTVEQVIDQLKQAKNETFFSTAQLTEYFLSIYNHCIYSADHNLASNAKLYFNFSANYIYANLHLDLSVDGLCKKLGVSQPYLYKVFKSETGRSPKQYILDMKLSRAEQLLAETDISITNVAYAVGFSDVLTFSSFFSKRAGVSPKAYRKHSVLT